MGDAFTKAEETKEEKEPDIDYANFKYEIGPRLTADELSKFDKEVQMVYNHKCKFEINKSADGTALSVSFYPSPHVKDDAYGKEVFEETPLTQSWFVKDNISKVEGIHDWDQKLIIEQDQICNFILCCCKAWTQHYPLKLSPSHILLLVLQGIAIHVDKNSEKLRDKYVQHEQTMDLKIYRDADADDFVFGRKDNDWSSVIKEFCAQIDKNTVADTVGLMESDFSCSTLVEKISSKVTVMDICKNYFRYYGYSGCACGFPKITLKGNKQDWIKLKIKCQQLLQKKVDKKFGAQWSQSLMPVLDRFIAAYDGNIDCIFWNSMVYQSERQYMGSGPSIPEQYHGWINVFFPFMQGYKGLFAGNGYCFAPYQMYEHQKLERWFGNGGVECSKYPSGLSSAPVTWTDLIQDETHKLKFYSGFMGYKQCSKTFELEPVVSWFIGHHKSK
eukprot:657802_1